ncbi:MAG: class I SAM-dependent methyltransferase [Actinomycetota bacterium]
MPEAEFDVDEMKLFSFKVWTYKMGEQVSMLIHLGDRLGLYSTLDGQGPMTSEAVAGASGLDERFVREWLLGQAAAGLIERTEDGRFEMTAVQAAVLADEHGSIAFSAGAFRGGTDPVILDRIAESFRTGIGITYEEQGPDAATSLARMTAPWSRQALTSVILPGLDGVVEKLEAGATVLDVGCGGGVTLSILAAAFPRTRCIGYDPSPSAIAHALEHAASHGATNAEFVVASGEDLPPSGDVDVVLTFDCLHDMAFPDRAAAAIRRAIAEDGTWLIKDIRSTGSFEQDSRNPLLAMFYGFSIGSCLQSATSEPGGLGLGTLGLHPRAAEELVTEAGFTRFATHDFDDAANLYYEVRP